jgi:putative endonuclease
MINAPIYKRNNLKNYGVYILKCSDNSYYTGVTSNFDKRIVEHQLGKHPNSYTFRRRPLELVYFEVFQDVNQAIAHEKQIKGWSRAKKKALIEGNWEKIMELSKRRT